MKTIALISVGQPSTNPRLVKEANALTQNGYKVYVIYSYWNQWAWESDKLLFPKARWVPVLAGGAPYKNKLLYFYTRLRLKLFRFIAQNLTLKFGVAEIAKGRTYPDLLKKAKSIKADLYIAHVHAALPAAIKAAKKNDAKCGFDAEDFHRREADDDTNSFYFKISKYLDDKYLPKADYITIASPLISREYEKLYPGLKNVVINNVFESDKRLEINPHKDQPIKLFWFSQTVGTGRGLEDVIEALALLNNYPFELHLLGDAGSSVKSDFLKRFNDQPGKIHFHEPIPADHIIAFANQFDIGLALEKNTPYNRDICLTNKIFTYVQSGLAVIASNTSAQTELMNQYPSIGKLYQGGDVQSLAEVLLYYQENRDQLFETRKAALNTAHKQLNWESESQKFLALVKQTIGE
ncbi:MAG: hypothetical protein JST50_00600 [Bacteroidetes bacterium]|nr:hypothetical protein [Bacteroidota bacterium]